jgi:hypothetical protein
MSAAVSVKRGAGHREHHPFGVPKGGKFLVNRHISALATGATVRPLDATPACYNLTGAFVPQLRPVFVTFQRFLAL